MRLVVDDGHGNLSLEEYVGDNIPRYAILSHTWGADSEEVTLKDLLEGTGKNKAGYNKIEFCRKQAASDQVRFFWVDTCCIDKSSSTELTEAINSMFYWYKNAVKCYVYLSDVETLGHATNEQSSSATWEPAFRESRWFRRGWTLQELIAPVSVDFFSREGDRLGSKTTLERDIHNITGIPVGALRGAPLASFEVEERMSWAKHRETKRHEDKAYSLFGIFDIHMPLLYGEGREKALVRLREEIRKSSKRKWDSYAGTGTFPESFEVASSKSRRRAVERKDSVRGQLHHAPSSSNSEDEGFQPTLVSDAGQSDHKAEHAVRPSQYHLLPRNQRFVGREARLETLTQKLLVTKECQRLALVGLGGIGKTQIALEFAYTVKETRSEFSIFWVAAVSAESFEQACTEIVRKLHINLAANEKEDVKELVKQHLSTKTAGKWLLIVDNADDMNVLFGSEGSIGIADYLPDSEDGLIVFTTRYQDAAVALAGGDVIELEEMSREEAVTFLERSLIRKDLLDDEAITTELLNELTYLPLAIAQAAAYLNTNKTISISEYLRLLRNTEQDIIGLMSREFHDSTRYRASKNAVATVWLVSFDQIVKLDPTAADLLSFMSCIEAKAIPRSILPVVQPAERTVHAIGTLSAYAFVIRRGNEEIYDLHRLVHLATRIWVRKNGLATETATKTIQHVAEVFPSSNYTNRELWREYLPHALKLLESTERKDSPKRHDLCTKVGRSLQADGRVREAVKWFEEAFRWTQDNLCEKDSDRLASQYVLAGAYAADGQVGKAVKLLEHVVAVRAKVQAEEHPDRLASQHALAGVYRADGQVGKAVELLEHVVAVEAKVQAEEHPDRLASQHALAGVYQADGQVGKAVELLEHVVAVRAKLLAEEHPDRLSSQHELARAYEADGQVGKAVKLLEHVVAVRAKVQAEEHPDRLSSQHELAGVYQADGQVGKAVELLEHVVAVGAKLLVEEHPDRLASQHELARAYQADGHVGKAVELLEHVVAVRAKVQAEEHPHRLASQHELARAYQADGHVGKAVELLEHVVAVRAKVQAEEHPHRLASQHALARAYEADGQAGRAIKLLEHVVAVRAKLLAEEHPDRLSSQHELAGVYQADGQVGKAVELLEHVVAVRAKLLLEEHPDRLASQHALAGAYQADGQVGKAVELLEHVVAVEAKLLAEEHPDRLASQHALAGVYRADGQVGKAVELLEHVVAVEAKVQAEEHPDRLSSQHELARAYEADGQVGRAIKLLEHVVAVRAKLLVEEHPDRLASQHELARAYEADGQVGRAIKLLEHVVAVKAKVFRDDHPSRLVSQQVLAAFRAESEADPSSFGEDR